MARSSINILLLPERKTPSLTVGLPPADTRHFSHSTTFHFSRKQSVQMSDQTEPPASTTSSHDEPQLIRGVGLWGATTLNMIDMIGVGPFITIPLIIAAMGGPQAMLGWIIGAILVTCDGLVWAELGAAFPGSGGSYRYLSEIYGPKKLGRMMSFLHLAAYLQRSAVDCIRRHRPGAIRDVHFSRDGSRNASWGSDFG
jgi:amino acid permease